MVRRAFGRKTRRRPGVKSPIEAPVPVETPITVAVAPVSGGGGGAGSTIAVHAVRFDGTSDSLSRTAAPTGATDGTAVVFAIPIKRMADGTLHYVWANSTGSYIRINANNTVEAFLADSAGVKFAQMVATATLTVSDGWKLLFVTPDVMYLDNTAITGTRTTGAATDMDWTSSFYWGRDSAGANRGNFELCRPWMALETLDMSVQGNRDLFATSFSPLTLADIKVNGSGPTGSQALDFLPQNWANFTTNEGSAQDFDLAGALEAGTAPAGAVLTGGAAVTPALEFDEASNSMYVPMLPF